MRVWTGRLWHVDYSTVSRINYVNIKNFQSVWNQNELSWENIS